MQASTPCPCCGNTMDPSLVVCWVCYRATNRLQPGIYHLGPSTQDPIHLTSESVVQWDHERALRIVLRQALGM